MASMQYAYRAQKSLGLVAGALPASLAPVDGLESTPATRAYAYSPDGAMWAVALTTGVRIHDTESGALVHELPETAQVVELSFSPKGTFLSTWERPQKATGEPNAPQHKNLRIFSSSTGAELVGFTQKSQEGWALQYTQDEGRAVRLVASEATAFKTSDWLDAEPKLTVTEKRKVEYATGLKLSPGNNPSVAIFVPEKKGAPASVQIFPLLTLATAAKPSSQKTFYKADRAQIKWNALGTACLVLTHTDVDNSNKSYYGENSLYLLHNGYGPRGDNGGSGERLTLDKDGPIHDFAWSGSSKEFGVVYGYMPAKTVLFDLRLRTLHDFGPGPVNYLSFNPSSRLVLLAGFGNLAGQVTIYDRRSLSKVCSIDAPNTSHCQWSPDGRYLMTATLSPRLRVDNGIRVWYCKGGELVHVQDVEELYQVGWRPSNVEIPFPNTIPPPPDPSPATLAHLAEKKLRSPPPAAGSPAPLKGAYRPPGARGLAAPSIFRREDEGGSPSQTPGPSRGSTPNPQRGGGAGGRYVPGAAPRNVPGAGAPRSVPGAPPRGVPGAPNAGGAQANGQGGEKDKRKRNKGAKNGGREPNAANGANANANGGSVVEANVDVVKPVPVKAAPVIVVDEEAQAAVQKKIRNLNKKLKAIDELKDKQRRGEKLEATQLKKMDGEAEIKRELAGVEASA